MPPPETLIDDDTFDSEAEDSDFAPDTVPKDVSSDSSDSESEADDNGVTKTKKAKSTLTKRKRVANDEAEDIGIENSGDEAIVSKALKRRRKKGAERDEDEGGEGGLIKTRRMRAAEEAEKKPLATTATATVDVDALWASMASGPPKAIPASQKATQNKEDGRSDVEMSNAGRDRGNTSSDRFGSTGARNNIKVTQGSASEDMITIKRTYNFAGQVHVEEKLVKRDSAEARLWLDSQSASPAPLSDSGISKPRRPPKKLKRSIFEPIPEPLPQRTDLHFGQSRVTGNLDKASSVNAKKLNTVEKSKMDWAGFVDKQGIKDELATAGKKKGAFMDQLEFLARVEEKKADEARKARMKG